MSRCRWRPKVAVNHPEAVIRWLGVQGASPAPAARRRAFPSEPIERYARSGGAHPPSSPRDRRRDRAHRRGDAQPRGDHPAPHRIGERLADPLLPLADVLCRGHPLSRVPLSRARDSGVRHDGTARPRRGLESRSRVGVLRVRAVADHGRERALHHQCRPVHHRGSRVDRAARACAADDLDRDDDRTCRNYPHVRQRNSERGGCSATSSRSAPP